MMNPTTLIFERDANSDFGCDTYCKMVIRFEETDIEVYYTLTDNKGFHRYKAEYSGVNFVGSLIPQFASVFAAYVYADDYASADGWMCVNKLAEQLSNTF